MHSSIKNNISAVSSFQQCYFFCLKNELYFNPMKYFKTNIFKQGYCFEKNLSY